MTPPSGGSGRFRRSRSRVIIICSVTSFGHIPIRTDTFHCDLCVATEFGESPLSLDFRLLLFRVHALPLHPEFASWILDHTSTPSSPVTLFTTVASELVYLANTLYNSLHALMHFLTEHLIARTCFLLIANHHTHNMFHRPLLDVPDPIPSFCSTTPPTTQTSLPMTEIKRSPCATPHGGLQFGDLVEPTPLTGYEPKTCIDVSSGHTPINYSSRRKSFNTDCNDLTTTVAASETPFLKKVGQSTSPLLFQEREVSSNPFCVSGFQQR